MNSVEETIMEKIHQTQFKLLSEFDQFCRKHDITYFLAAGTLLGAARHKDFIPWDDDVDVYIKREDYERLMLYKDEFTEPFEIHMPTEEDTFFWDFTTRLVYKKSKLKFDEKENAFYNHKNNEYLFVDIFVLDKTYDTLKGKLQLFAFKVIYGLAMSKRYKIKYQDYPLFFDKCKVFVLSNIGRVFPMKVLLHWYKKIQTKYETAPDAKLVIPSTGTITYLTEKEIFPTEWFTEFTELSIRGKYFTVSKEYHELLKQGYGDYMQLPPIEQQCPTHADILSKVEIN